jgi:hypothetical protein
LWRHAFWSIDLRQSHLSYAYINHLRQFALRDKIVVGTASSTTAVMAIVISPTCQSKADFVLGLCCGGSTLKGRDIQLGLGSVGATWKVIY